MGEWGRSALTKVDSITGIGPRIAEVLADLGFGSVQALAALRPDQAESLADVVAGLSPAGMQRSVAEATFHLLSPDGGLLAAALVEDGITSPLELLAAPTQRIENLTPGWETARVAALQLQAARVGLTFQVLLRVLDGGGDPIARPRVEVANSGLADRRPVVAREGDDDGWVLTPPLRRDRAHRVFVLAAGFRRTLRVTADWGLVQRRTLVLSDPPRGGPVTPERTLLVGPATYLLDEITMAQAVDGQVFRVGDTQQAEVPLYSAQRSYLPGGVITVVLRVPPTELPNGAVAGNYVAVEAGAIRPAGDDERDSALQARGGLLAERLRP